MSLFSFYENPISVLKVIVDLNKDLRKSEIAEI